MVTVGTACRSRTPFFEPKDIFGPHRPHSERLLVSMKRTVAEVEVDGDFASDYEGEHSEGDYDGDYPTPKKSRQGSDNSDHEGNSDGGEEAADAPKKKKSKMKLKKANQIVTRMPLAQLKVRDPNYKPVAQTIAYRKFDPNSSLKRQFKVPTFTNGEKADAYGSGPPVLGMLRRINMLSRGLHDPEEDGAIVLYGW